MTNEQESRFSMYLAETGFCDSNATITTTLPNFATNVSSLKATCTQIQVIGEQQKIDKKGITQSKNQLRAQLVVLAADNARKLTAFAKFTNNQTLMAEVHYSESDFKKFADSALKDYAQIIYDRAQTNVAALTTYGITAATQTAFLSAITTYNATLATPRIGTTVTSQATKQLVTLFKAGDTALANMDAAVEIIRLSQPNFYNGYKAARKIIQTGAGSLSVKGVVTDASTGKPIKGVTVSFALDGGSMMMAKASTATSTTPDTITKKTAKKGGFNIKSLPAGTYQVTIKKAGYTDQVITININDGEMTDFNAGISKT